MTHPLGPVCRYFSKPGVGVERSAVPGAPAGHPGQASGSGNGGAQRGDAAGCPAFQRGQRPAASPPATAQLQARQLEAAEEAYRAPGPGLRLPAATCTGGGANLVKMSQLARSTPQLDEYVDGKERLREREKSSPVHYARDALISQVVNLSFFFFDPINADFSFNTFLFLVRICYPVELGQSAFWNLSVGMCSGDGGCARGDHRRGSRRTPAE